MAIVSINNKPQRVGHKRTFGELKVCDTYYAYLKARGGIEERTVLKTEPNYAQYKYIVKIGGPVVEGDYINVRYGTWKNQYNVVYKDSSITINKHFTLMYATTKEELEEAIKYYS